MKSMTCKDMGGVCDTAMTAETPEEMMKKGGDHVMAATDEAHAPIKAMMAESMKDPAKLAEWQKMFTAKWDAAPTVAPTV